MRSHHAVDHIAQTLQAHGCIVSQRLGDSRRADDIAPDGTARQKARCTFAACPFHRARKIVRRYAG